MPIRSNYWICGDVYGPNHRGKRIMAEAGQMTPHERFLSLMRFEPMDRMPVRESDPLPSTLRRWQGEGLGQRSHS